MARVKVAVFPFNATGHLNPLLAIVAALSAGDDAVKVLSVGPPELARPFTAVGARHIGIDTASRVADDGPPPPSELADDRFIRPLATVEKYVRCIENFHPDVVLYDVYSVQGFVAARYLGVPSASLVTIPGYGALGDGFVEKHGQSHPGGTSATRSPRVTPTCSEARFTSRCTTTRIGRRARPCAT